MGYFLDRCSFSQDSSDDTNWYTIKYITQGKQCFELPVLVEGTKEDFIDFYKDYKKKKFRYIASRCGWIEGGCGVTWAPSGTSIYIYSPRYSPKNSRIDNQRYVKLTIDEFEDLIDNIKTTLNL